MSKNKIPKTKHKEWHTSKNKMGLGDYYGTGITAKMGIIREGLGFEGLSQKKLKTPPKTLA